MAVWLIRAGAHGEYEEKFITENRVYVTWEYLDVDLSKLKNKDELTAVMNANVNQKEDHSANKKLSR